MQESGLTNEETKGGAVDESKIIEVCDLTKDYGFGRGVFDINLTVPKGQCFGFLGPNGAGKTTLIRHMMGFSRPQKGYAKINGMDAFENAALLEKSIGYLPGEIALPRGMTGTYFLNMMSNMRMVEDRSYEKELLDRFELDPKMDTKRMALGVKRKLAVVAAFLHDPDILILDEPTSGLDPIMQETFIDFIKSEKQRGKTIFMSSHIFHEVDACCDRIAIIKDGHVVDMFYAEDLKKRKETIYRVSFYDQESYDRFLTLPFDFTSVNSQKLRVRVTIDNERVNELVSAVSQFAVKDFIEIPYTLEDHFMKFYRGDHHFAEVK